MSAGVATRGVYLSQERDYNHVSDNEYRKLRDMAQREMSRRAELAKQSQEAYQNGDKQRAHDLSVEAKNHAAKADEYNDKAAEYVFVANNADSDGNEIDLHGLFVKEAEEILKKRINSDLSRGASQLEVIVGKGLHSKGGVAKIKPAVEELCQEAGLRCHVDSKNTGVLVIEYPHGNVVPHWPQNQQPQPHPQPHYGQGGQNQPQNQNGTGNALLDGLLQLFCFCIKNYAK